MTLSNRARFSSKGLNILFVIPAREGSQRLIGKNYKKIQGKSLLKLKIDNCKKSCLGNIVVTSDCPIILDQAKKEFDNILFLSFEQTKDKEIAKLLGIEYWTTIVVYKNNKEIARSIGQTKKSEIYELIKS